MCIRDRFGSVFTLQLRDLYHVVYSISSFIIILLLAYVSSYNSFCLPFCLDIFLLLFTDSFLTLNYMVLLSLVSFSLFDKFLLEVVFHGFPSHCLILIIVFHCVLLTVCSIFFLKLLSLCPSHCLSLIHI